MRAPIVLDDPDIDGEELGALAVLRRGLAVSPELRVGLVATVVLAFVNAGARVIVPILVQQTLERGISDDGVRSGFLLVSGGIAVTAVVVFTWLSRVTYLRLVNAAETMLAGLRTRVFAHVHDLSLSEQSTTRRGVLVSRVTSDVETLARFAQWGAISWIVNTVVIAGCLLAIAVFSWQMALVTLLVHLPLLPMMSRLQRRQLAAYDQVRTRIGETLGEISETVMGAEVIRAYGLSSGTRRRLHDVVDRWYDAQMRATRLFSTIFALGDVFGGLALGCVVGAAALWGTGWGIDFPEMVAILFLTTLIVGPVQELGEILDQTQTAIAGWRKVLAVLDLPIDVVDPEPGLDLPDGPLRVRVEDVDHAYRTGPTVLEGIDLDIAPGRMVAVVGETGSGKTTLAKLLCRLADPIAGRILVGGVDLREVSPGSRHERIRMVPQDGFLFDATIRDNLLMAAPNLDDDALRAAFDGLELGWWLDRLPAGLDTPVGERGENLSVGERQLVALARAQVSGPGLLILDEATSSVDPETERAVSAALAAMTERRDGGELPTMVVIAHRLSTAELADEVVVVDAGRIVETGTHDELVEAGGVYARLHTSWLGATRN